MATRPSIKLSLTPRFNASGAVDGLSVLYTVSSPGVKAGDILFRFETRDGSGHSNYRYDENDIIIFDDAGPFAVHFSPTKDAKHTQEWTVSRDTVGDVVVQLQVRPPRNTGSPATRRVAMTPFGARTGARALQSDQGGMVGSGRWFLPCLVARSLQTLIYDNVVDWDLDAGPPRTRAVCSLGEGPGPVSRIGDAETLLDMAFMVGPLHSYPPGIHEAAEVAASSSSNTSPTAPGGYTYWLGHLPPNIHAVRDYSTKIFPQMSEFFRDQGGNYRLFVQKVTRGFGASGFVASSILEYDEQSSTVSDYDMVRLLNQQMVYSWNRLDPGRSESEVVWFNRGFALLYSVFLPFRFGQRSPDYFRATLNAFLSAYFTNPLLRTPLPGPESSTGANSWYGQAMQYTRGFLFALKLDTYSRWASRETKAGVTRPIDEIIGDISAHRRNGHSIGVGEFLTAVSAWLGNERAQQLFRDMKNGNVMELKDMPDSFGDIHCPAPFEQEILDFGFDCPDITPEGYVDASFIVSGLVPGSRAEQAGLMNGDRVVDCGDMVGCLTDLGRRLSLRVEREGRLMHIDYWPRSWSKIVSWQVVERDKVLLG